MNTEKFSQRFGVKTTNAISDFFKKIFNVFSLTEKTLFLLVVGILIISGISIVWTINQKLLIEVPAHGGEISEGIIGSPRFINPLLELSDADRDLTYLVYSGLLRATPNGDLIPDLAESYSVSDDGLTFTFKLRGDVYFHDGVKITADDIEYTILTAQDVNLRSPKRNNWDPKYVSINKLSPNEVEFNLKQAYPGFLENMTMGILPKHIWNSASTDEFPFTPFNTNPIGSGPYQISSIKRNSSGIPLNYNLTAFKKYALGEPYISNLSINFYPNEKALTDAYLAGNIKSIGSVSTQNMESILKKTSPEVERISLPRVFGLFFNQNQAKIFINKEVREVLDMTTDKDRIVREVLQGYGTRADSPIPPSLSGITASDISTSTFDQAEVIEKAKQLLEKNGWKFNEEEKVWQKKISKKETQTLTFSISTSNTSNLKSIAEILVDTWNKLGIKVDIKTFDQGDLNQSVISQRNYDALLFGEVIGRNMDMFPFWHSSQRNYPGNNIAMYTNARVDKLLEDARKMADKQKRNAKYDVFIDEVNNDIPAIFIYSPDLIYLLPETIKGFDAGLISNPSERFENIYKWYIETDKVWKFLNK